MKKNKYVKYVISTIIICFFIIFCLKTFVNADFNPNDYNIQPGNTEVLNTKYSGVIDIIQNIGTYASVIALIILGIKYMVSSVQEKAEYKEKMFPYVIGATFVFAISRIIALIYGIGGDITSAQTVEDIGGKIIALLSTIGSIISIIMLVILGIKYMGGSIEEKAEYKKTLMPYVIGAALVFSASAIAGIVYQLAKGL